MAGSYQHIVDKQNNFLGDVDEELLLDNLGDTYEALEECYATERQVLLDVVAPAKAIRPLLLLLVGLPVLDAEFLKRLDGVTIPKKSAMLTDDSQAVVQCESEHLTVLLIGEIGHGIGDLHQHLKTGRASNG